MPRRVKMASMGSRRYDLVVVGMGSAGIVAAEFAAAAGLRTVVVERARVGGDCLWTGCVPSKALLASAKVAHHLRHAGDYGMAPVEPAVDGARVWGRIREIQASIAATDDNPDRFRALGVEVVEGHARLAGPHAVEVDGRTLATRFVLLATGSRPAVPAVPGIVEAGFLTSENLFELKEPPASLVAIGGGPIAVEMAQACRRLGIAVTLLQRGPRILPRDEHELAGRLAGVLVAEGVDLRCNVRTEGVSVEDGRKIVSGTEAGRPFSVAAQELLVAVGRWPNVEGLGLEEMGVQVGSRGVEVDESLRTSVPSVYAVGDLAGRFLFTHSAGYEAVVAIRDMFFPGRGRAGDLVPWCTFTDPELAHVGFTASEAEERFGAVEVHRLDLGHSDRARSDGTTEGAIHVVTHKGRLVGAHVLAPAAGEMIHELALAIRQGIGLADLGGLVHVYPTLSTGIGQLGAEAAFARARRLRLLAWWGRLGAGRR